MKNKLIIGGLSCNLEEEQLDHNTKAVTILLNGSEEVKKTDQIVYELYNQHFGIIVDCNLWQLWRFVFEDLSFLQPIAEATQKQSITIKYAISRSMTEDIKDAQL